MDMQEKDYEWFLENMESLYKKYGRKFAIIKNQTALGIYGTFNEALETAKKTEELGTFLVQEIFKNKEALPVSRSGYFAVEKPFEAAW